MKKFLKNITKPARYIGIEPNAVIKEPKDIKVRFALCYPDIYEVGMSYYGFFLLYELANSIDGVWCERCFAPWVDMEQYLKENHIPLFTLESKTPLNEMDIIGFSLTYELNITNVLNILKLSHIPIKAIDRENMPIIIAGGALTLNPLPFEDFFDLIVVGEAENALVHILERLKELKGTNRWEIINILSELEGVYSPLLEKKIVKRLYIKDLNNAPHPIKPPIPATGSIHNRLNIEISRGCGNGCRFCMAGFGYRPYRERSFETLREIINRGLENTGYEEISFLSLSSGDYSHLFEVITYVKNTHKNTSVSLPSLKIGSLSKEEIITIGSIARTGFTFALEAPTETLRCRLNKDLDIEKFFSQLPVLKKCGWRNIKLYLMIGFPWETEHDLKAIKDTINEFKRHGIGINLSISPFVPKPHTPFQWLPMDKAATIKEKIEIIKSSLKKDGVKIKYRDINVSLIEGIISRGDKSITPLFEYLGEKNIRLEAWSEFFNFENYRSWFEKKGIDMNTFLKERETNIPLPWEFIDTGIGRTFLLNELKNAQRGIYTKDCYSNCSACGLICDMHIHREKTIEIKNINNSLQEGIAPSENTKKITFRYKKLGNAKYISHLDTMNMLLRAFKACGIYIKTHGKFHPIPKITMSDALPVGIESTCEFIEIEINTCYLIDEGMIKKINTHLPNGLKIIELYEKKLKDIKKEFEFIVICNSEVVNEQMKFLFKKNGKTYYTLRTDRIKEFLKFDTVERIIKLKGKRTDAFRTYC